MRTWHRCGAMLKLCYLFPLFLYFKNFLLRYVHVEIHNVDIVRKQNDEKILNLLLIYSLLYKIILFHFSQIVPSVPKLYLKDLKYSAKKEHCEVRLILLKQHVAIFL